MKSPVPAKHGPEVCLAEAARRVQMTEKYMAKKNRSRAIESARGATVWLNAYCERMK